MNKILLLLICFAFLHAKGQGDIYSPLKTVETFPSHVFTPDKEKVSKLVKNENLLDKNIAREFYTRNQISIKSVLTSGKVYFNGELTEYLNSIAKTILKDNPNDFQKLKIYALRSSEINAVSYPDGHIFVNTGLIATLKNADELAFILAHEINHYLKEHAKKAVLKNITIAGEQSGGVSYFTNTYRSLKYSRENEQDADAAALQLIINSNYIPSTAIKALLNLKDSDTANAYVPDVFTLFNTDVFKVDSSNFDINDIKKLIDEIKKKFKDEYGYDIEEDDTYSTHPDIEKRFLALQEILKASEVEQRAKKTPDTGFDKIKNVAAKETVFGLFVDNEYILCLYHSLRLLENDSTNVFFKLYTIKSLYMLAYLRKADKLKKLTERYFYTNDGVRKLSYFISNLSTSDLNKMTFGYMNSLKEEMEVYDEFMIYKALIIEQYLGKEASKSHYSSYLKKFPNGKHKVIAKTKLK